MKKLPVFASLVLLFCAIPCYAQTSTATATPAPTSSTVTFNIGASALGLGGTSQSTPASDITLHLGLGLAKAPNLYLKSDSLLAPGANLQYYGGGVGDCFPHVFGKNGPLSGLILCAEGSVGADRIVPSSGPSQSHVAFMAGGYFEYQTSSGVNINLVGVEDLHTPGAPWGSNAPAVQGGISYFFGKH